MVLRIWVSATSLCAPSMTIPPAMGVGALATEAADAAGAAEAGAALVAAGVAAARSRRITRPPGPDPATARRSIPCSAAMRRARGELRGVGEGRRGGGG